MTPNGSEVYSLSLAVGSMIVGSRLESFSSGGAARALAYNEDPSVLTT